MKPAEESHQQFLHEIERLLRHSRHGGDLQPAATPEDWERTIASVPEASRELLRELARFADLWRFLSEHEQDLGENVVAEMGSMHKLPVAERLARLKQINQKLLGRVEGASRGNQLRQ